MGKCSFLKDAYRHRTGTQVSMHAHNKGCVTSLVSLPRFCVTNPQVIKTKLHVCLVNRGVPPPAMKRQTEPEKKKIFFSEKWLRRE